MVARKKFLAGDNIMASDHGKLYSARVLKVQVIGSAVKYFIHYNNWDRKYDTWIDEALVAARPANDKKSAVKLNKPSDQHVQPSESPSKLEIRTRKRAREAESAESCSAENATEPVVVPEKPKKSKPTPTPLIETLPQLSKQEIKTLAESELSYDDDLDPRIPNKLGIPFPLKKFLVDEWGLVTCSNPITNRKLLPLPRPHTVKDAIAAHLLEKKQGLVTYFDKALPVILLYRQERPQYDVVASELSSLPPSEVYGCEHLNRLFCKFYRLMSGVVFPAGEEASVLGMLSEFFQFLQRDSEKYLCIDAYVLAAEAMAIAQGASERKEYPSFLEPPTQLDQSTSRKKTTRKSK